MKIETTSTLSKVQYPAIIFGAGEAGIAAANRLSADYDIVAFCDNDNRKIGQTLMSSPIISPTHLKRYLDCTIFIASEFSEQILAQLKDNAYLDSEKIQVLPAEYIKPISFGQDLPTRKMAEKILSLISNHLNQQKVKHYVDAGTLLGIFRDGDLIPWDDDLDFAIDSCDIAATSRSLLEFLPILERQTASKWQLIELKNDRNFGAVKVGELRGFKLKPERTDSSLPLIDFFIKYVDGEWMDYTLASRGIRMPSYHIANPQKYDFKGQIISIPMGVEAYLERHYGDWRTPKQDWNLSDIQSATVFIGQA